MLGGFSIFALLPRHIGFIAIFVSIAICVLSLLFKPGNNSSSKIVCFSLLFSILLSFFYFNYVFFPGKYFEEEASVIGKIEDIEVKSDQFRIIDIDVYEIDDKRANYKFKLNLYGEYDDINVGNVISFTAKINEFSEGSDFNFRQYYMSRGFSATCDTTKISVERIESAHLSYKFKLLRQNIIKLATKRSNSFAGALFGALLLGEKQALDGQLLLDFQRIGISHILALSGMHVAILMGALDRILYLFKFKKTLRIVFGCIASFMFMLLTGFPLSVARAGFMLIISSVLYLITGCKDSITSLFVAVALIFIISPFAALDVGLWLSVLATFGILAASEFINEKYSDEKGIKRFGRYLYTSVLFSLFAVAASSVISALSFSGTSVVSILSTLIFSILVELYVYMGMAVLLLGKFIPLGTVLAKFASFIASLAAEISDIPFIYGSLEFTVVKVGFVCLFVLFILFTILTIKNKTRFIAVIALGYAFMSILTVSMTEIEKNNDKFVAFSDSGDRIVIKSDGKTLLFDSSNHRSGDAYYTNSILYAEKITELDCYFIANYSNYLQDTLNIVLKNTKIKNLLLPLPESDDEENIAIECFKVINNYRTKVEFYDRENVTKFSEYEILGYIKAFLDNSYAFTFKRDNEIYSYMSSGILENTPYAEQLLFVSDKIVFGDYGVAYSKDFVIDEFDKKLKQIIIFDKKVSFDFTYIDWPAPEVVNSRKTVVLFD